MDIRFSAMKIEDVSENYITESLELIRKSN